MQIRTRLTLQFLLQAAGILAAVLFGVFWMFKKNTEDAFFKGLESKVKMTSQTVLPNYKNLAPLPHNWVAPEDDDLPYQDNISIYDNAYERIFSVLTYSVPITARELQEIYQNGETRFTHFNLQAYGKKIDGPAGAQFVVVAEGYCDPSNIMKLRNILIISFLIGILLVAISGWYYAGKVLEPMAQIVREVETIQPSDLSKRVISGKNKDELTRLADTFNLLLDRVEQAFQMQRMFVSNVSHELKNPITAIRSQLDVALQRDREPEAYRKALQSVLDDVCELGETEQKLLHLARVYNSPQTIQMEAVRLDELLWQSIDQLHKRHPDFKATIELIDMPEMEDGLYVVGNEQLLRLALLNLMNNGCKYSPDNKVHIRAIFKPGGAHEIEICDNGDGIAEEERKLIFEPFFRSPRHLAVKGTGIGLSLVKSILNLHQIALFVECPASGGSVFRITFPPAALVFSK